MTVYKGQASSGKSAVILCAQGRKAVSGKGLKVLYRVGPHSFLLCPLKDGLCQRMFAFCLQGISQGKEGCFRIVFCRDQICYFWLPFGNGACFVQGYNLHFSGFFQGNGSLKQDAVFCTHTISDHDGNGGGKAQSTGAADNQH